MVSGIVRLTVNDHIVYWNPKSEETLLSTLRDGLGYTDVKAGCHEGACGTCTVILNDRPVPSCLILTATLEDATIYTWTGVMNDPTAQRLYSVFHEMNAFQCGFCENGILLHFFAELRAKKVLSRETAESILNSHICRCGGYRLMMEAISEFLNADE